MLTSRNAIALTISLAVISLLWSCWSLLQPPDGDGLRSDSYGTYGHGQRAVFDTIRELGLPIRRSLGPPLPANLQNARLVMWRPSSDIVRVEQKWLEGVGNWVRDGGRVLVAIGVEELDWLSAAAATSESAKKSQQKKTDDKQAAATSHSLWELLHLPGVTVSAVGSQMQSDLGMPAPIRQPARDVRDMLRSAMQAAATDTERVEYGANASGVLEPLIGDDRKLSLPTDGVFEIQFGNHVPTGMITLPGITVPGVSDDETCIVARFTVGLGEVTVVSVPALIENSVIGEADNVVVLSKLLVDDGREIVVDEFYHGLAIRGNAMWLFAQRTYGTMTLALLLVIGLVGWRESVFLGTPLAERPVSRRAIREYVEAMARFLREGRGAGAWIVAKLRDGVLWHLRREHGLPPEQHSETQLLAAIERRDPDRAAEVSSTLQAIQNLLQTGQAGQERRAIPLMRRMVECLSKNATARCATKSQR